MASNPSVRTNAATKPSSKLASTQSLPVVQGVRCSQSHSEPIKEHSTINTTQTSLIIPLPTAVSWCLEERFPTARKWSRPLETYVLRSVL